MAFRKPRREFNKGTRRKGPFGLGGEEEYITNTPREQFHINRQHQMHKEADAILASMPEGQRNNPMVQDAVDASVAARYLATDPRSQMAMGGVLGAGAVGAGLSALNDQQQDFLPTDPLSVAGRMASNINPFGEQASVGVDPLADARNKLTEAGTLAGSGGVLKALAADEVDSMASRQEAMNQAAMADEDLMMLQSVSRMIDARAAELKSQPWVDATGNTRQFTEAEAQRLATEQVNMQLRASGIY